jgi:hypothetical protein
MMESKFCFTSKKESCSKYREFQTGEVQISEVSLYFIYK